MLKRVYHVKLHGEISSTSFTGLRMSLKRRLLHRPIAVAVSINSVGGSVVGAKNIARHINHFSQELEVPLYTFAEDICLGAANIVLASGWKAYANPYSLIGDFGSTMTHTSAEDLLKRFDVDVLTVREGSHKDRLSKLRNLDASDLKLMQALVQAQEDEIRQEVFNYRQKGFRRKRLDSSEVSGKLFDGKNTVEDYKALGLVDDISTLHEVINKDFGSGTRTLELNLNSIASSFVKSGLFLN